MPKFSLHICQSVLRAGFLLGVLSGLLFSCGEGIRLLPFPASEITQNAQSLLNDAGESGYHKNILRLEKGEGGYLSKFQQLQHWTNVFDVLNYSTLSASAIRNKIDFPVDFQFTKTNPFSASSGSRAPPFFVNFHRLFKEVV